MPGTGNKVLVLGASGLLGRAVLRELQAAAAEEGFGEVVGTACSRVGEGLVRLDASDHGAVVRLLEDFKPSVVLNCVAERRPDVVDQQPERTQQLNVALVSTLATQASKPQGGFFLVHVSTDYVFDGTSPPYRPADACRPLQLYGQSKLQAEEAVIRLCPSQCVVLRVPVLYGTDSRDLNESSITALAKDVMAQAPKKVEDWAARYPTCVDDVAYTIHRIVHRRLRDDPSFHGVLHYSSKQTPTGGPYYTKFRLAQLLGEIMGLTTDHLGGDPNPPAGAPRPHNCELDISATEEMGLTRADTPIRDGLRRALIAAGVKTVA